MAKGLTWTIDDADHMTQAEIYGEVLTQLGAQNEKIVALTADLAGSTKIGRFEKDFPDRFINLGVAEMNMMGMSSGMAAVGFIPVVSTFAVFASLRCAEFVRTDICYQNRNVKIIATHSGTSFGQAGTTHHCTEDLAVMRSFSNMKVIAPADSFETAREEKERPTVIIANTIKGKGVDFMENQASWHYGGLDEAMQAKALESLGKE
jgi:transketolase